MITNAIKYITFTLVFVYSFLWTAINLSISSFGNEKVPVTIIENQDIQKLILNKTGINVGNIKISESPHPFGMMIGIPENTSYPWGDIKLHLSVK